MRICFWSAGCRLTKLSQTLVVLPGGFSLDKVNDIVEEWQVSAGVHFILEVLGKAANEHFPEVKWRHALSI